MNQKKGYSYFSILLNTASAVVSLTCMISISAAFISPSVVWWPAFFSLGFNFIYATNLFFLIVQLLRKTRYVLIPLLPFVAGFTTAFNSINFFENNQSVSGKNDIKVMSYNVRLFDLYNWSHNMETRNEIFNFLKHENADIICLQEFYHEENGKFVSVNQLKKLLHLPYAHTAYSNSLKGIYHFGIATFSRYPIVSHGEIRFGKKNNSNNCIYTDVLINSDTVRVFNAHLESIRFKKEDYRFIENIESINDKNDIKGGKTIIRRLKNAFEKRAIEADLLASYISKSPHPVIFCGDFNDTPASYTYQVISENLHDSFKYGSPGYGATYNGPFPAFRIDYILYSDELIARNQIVHPPKLSDHFPVTCLIQLKNE